MDFELSHKRCPVNCKFKFFRWMLVLAGIMLTLLVKGQTDTLYTLTGDVLVGEIKSMKLGVLTFDTDYADDEFQIEWLEVNGLKSSQILLIFTRDGRKLIGSMRKVEDVERIARVETFGASISVSLFDIVEIRPLKERFFDRIQFWLDAGYSLSKANNTQQLSISARVQYQTDKWMWNADFNKVGTYQDNVDESSRTSGGSNFNYFIKGKLFATAGMEFLRNSEQKLDLRRTSKVGLGYYWIRTNRWYLANGVGIARTNENYGGDDPTTNNEYEALGVLDLNAYDIGDLKLRTKLDIYPSLTDKGIRLNGEFSVKYDLPFDFYIKLSYTGNYDSNPAIDVPQLDYVFQTSIGWEWD